MVSQSGNFPDHRGDLGRIRHALSQILAAVLNSLPAVLPFILRSPSPGCTVQMRLTTGSFASYIHVRKLMKAASYHRAAAGTQPDYFYPPYVSTSKRHPKQPLILLPHTLSELTGPVFGHSDIGENDNDLTRQHSGEAVGERIIVSGRVLDEEGRAIPGALVEVWQPNAAGPYRHRVDHH